MMNAEKCQKAIDDLGLTEKLREKYRERIHPSMVENASVSASSIFGGPDVTIFADFSLVAKETDDFAFKLEDGTFVSLCYFSFLVRFEEIEGDNLKEIIANRFNELLKIPKPCSIYETQGVE